MRAERTTQMAVELARDFGATTVSIRGFRQLVDDQLVTVFGAENPEYPGSKLGHYVVGNAGDAQATGATSRSGLPSPAAFTGRSPTLRPALKSCLGTISGTSFSSRRMPARPLPAQLHDVTTSIETEVPETSTRVVILYRDRQRLCSSVDGRASGNRASILDSIFRFDRRCHF